MKLHLLTPTVSNDPTASVSQAIELLTQAAKDQGHSLDVISSDMTKMRFTDKVEVLVNNKKVKIKFLIVRPAFGLKNNDIHANVIRQFELTGVPTLNSYGAVMIAKDKIRTMQVLSKKKIPVPKTYVVTSAEFVPEIMQDIGKYPVILKVANGKQGVGVSIVESQRGLRSMIELLMDQEDATPLIIQEYIKESTGKDIRIFVVGDKIVAAMERIATRKGEFRSNFSMGGKVKIASLTDEEKRIAIKATKACGLDYAGVDLIRSKSGPKILEVNANPGYKGIMQATGVNVAAKIIELAVKRATESTTPPQTKKKKR